MLHDDEVYTDPQILARDTVAETNHSVTGPFRAMGVAVKVICHAGVFPTTAAAANRPMQC